MTVRKEILVNDEIRAAIPKLKKLQLWTAAAVGIVLIALFAAVTVPLWQKYGEKFLLPYAFATFVTCAVPIAFAAIVPFEIKMRRLLKRQAEELAGDPISEKYLAVLKLGNERCEGAILAAGVAIGLTLTWVLAIVFPHEIYATLGFVVPVVVLCAVLLTVSYFKQEKIRAIEDEIINARS